MKKKTVKLNKGNTQFDKGDTKFDTGKAALNSRPDTCFVTDSEGSQKHPAKPAMPLNMKFIE